MPPVEMLWGAPPRELRLLENEVHVWRVGLAQSGSRTDALSRLLSEGERQRAQAFRIEKKRGEYVVCRATLRRLLGEYLALSPEALVFNSHSRGKPELAGAPSGKIHFNLSHTDGLALIAVARRCPVGVDVEHVRPLRDDLQIARRFFTSSEAARLEALPEAERPLAFFNLWTRKEAWLKATGEGITERLNRMAVTFLPGDPARVLNVDGQPDEADAWTLKDLKPADGFTGAVAFRAPGLNVRCWRHVE